MSKKNYKISLIINIIIILMVTIASIIMFTGYKFMDGKILLESSKLGMFKFFTVDSNLFMGIVSILFVIEETRLLKGKINSIPTSMYILKLMATTGVTLTFLVVFIYLAPLTGSMYLMITNSNLFFHLLIPILSIITFTLFEKNNRINFKYSFYGLITVIIYAIYYLINVLIHIENNIISPEYDWYYFVQNGVRITIIIAIMILIISYTISFLLWKLNKVKK